MLLKLKHKARNTKAISGGNAHERRKMRRKIDQFDLIGKMSTGMSLYQAEAASGIEYRILVKYLRSAGYKTDYLIQDYLEEMYTYKHGGNDE